MMLFLFAEIIKWNFYVYTERLLVSCSSILLVDVGENETRIQKTSEERPKGRGVF